MEKILQHIESIEANVCRGWGSDSNQKKDI